MATKNTTDTTSNGLVALPALPKAARKRGPMKPCACGCGEMVERKFAAGHDSRLRGWAIRLSRGVVTEENFPGTAGELAAAKAYLATEKTKARKAATTPKTAAAQGPKVRVAKQPQATTGGDSASA